MPHTAVLFGGPSDEHDISILTGLQVARALGDVETIYWSKSGEWFLVPGGLEAADFIDGVPAKSRDLTFSASPGAGFLLKRKPIGIDTVFIACHGGPGEDGTVQGLFDLAEVAYTGPGQAASALGMDKLAFGSAMASLGLSTLPRTLVALGTEDSPGFEGPYIVKPRFGGSSIGIEIAGDWETVLALTTTSSYFDQGAVVEPFIEATRDLQVAVRTYPGIEVSAVEAPSRADEGIYSYDQKYLDWGGDVSGGRQLPARLTPELEQELRQAAICVASAAGLRGIARIDFLERESVLYVNEVNTIPGSMSAYLWIDPPIDRQTLFGDMVAEARSTTTRVFSVAGSDGTALRSAGTIASKLG